MEITDPLITTYDLHTDTARLWVDDRWLVGKYRPNNHFYSVKENGTSVDHVVSGDTIMQQLV